jgi:general secretion pathway protein C
MLLRPASSAAAPVAPTGLGSLTSGAAGAGSGRWVPAWVAAVVWLGVGLLLGYGGLQGWGRGALSVPAPSSMPPEPSVNTANVARALGAVAQGPVAMPVPSVAPVVPARYTLAGVMAVGRDGQTGVALIATDGQKAKPYRVGADIDGRWRVQSVAARTVVLSPLASVVHTDSQGPMTLTLPVPAVAPQGGATPQPAGRSSP